MEAVLQNSTISLTNLSQASNPSTARLLIDHIKRLVEDDMKLTVEAFKLIENEIVFDHESLRRKNKSNRSSAQSQHLRSSSTKQSELTFPNLNDQQNYQENITSPTSGRSIYTVNVSNANQMQKKNSIEKNSMTSTPIRNRSSEGGRQYQNSQHSRLSEGYLSTSQNHDREDAPVTSSTPGGSSFNISSIQQTKSEDSKLSKNNSSLRENNRRKSVSSRNGQSSDNASNVDITTDDNLDEDFISLTRVASMFHSRFTEEIKKVMDRIHQRFTSESHSRTDNVKKPVLQTITRRVYDDFSPTWTYGNAAASANTQQPSLYSSDKDRTKIRLPQLLGLSGSSKLSGSDLTIDSENIAVFDSRYQRNVETSETDDRAQLSDNATYRSNGNKEIDENVADVVMKGAIDALEISDGANNSTDDGTEKIDDNANETNDKTQSTDERPEVKSIDESGSVGNDIVTITDIGSETKLTKTSNATPKATDNDLPHDEELTDTFSSSLVTTPKTGERGTSREWTDLDEIATLINQASPSRRIVIKKKMPDVDVKGYSKSCNEKIIFSGNKITHVKTDRKTMCRNFNPKQNTEN